MKCIYCAKKKTEVTNSREIKKGLITWRRRNCPNCGRTFTTKESPIADNVFVIKRNGARQRFIYEKMFASIFAVINSGKYKDNGVAAKLAKKVAGAVMERIFSVIKDKEISTQKIIELVHKELKRIDPWYANAYGTYSDYRTKTLLQLGLMRVPEVYR